MQHRIRVIVGLALGAGLFALAGATVAADETLTYTYDVHGRLVSVQVAGGATTAYAYDPAGNRTSKVITGAMADLSVVREEIVRASLASPAVSASTPAESGGQRAPRDEPGDPAQSSSISPETVITR